jgi:hypothetical protein
MVKMRYTEESKGAKARTGEIVELLLVNLDLEHLLEGLLDDDLIVLLPRPLGEKHVAVLCELLDVVGLPSSPPEKVSERSERLLGLEDSTSLTTMLELLEDRDDPFGVREGDLASLAENSLELRLGDVIEVDFEESVSERAREDLSTTVETGRVLRREEHEVGVRTDDLLRLGDDELSVVVEQSVQSLEDVGRGEVELVENDPVSSSDRSDEDTFLEDELAGVGIGDVRSEVLLNIGVLVIIDSDETVTRSPSKVLDRTRLSARRRTLDENGEPIRRDDSGEINKLGLDGGRENVVGRLVDLLRSSLEPERTEPNKLIL